MNPWEKYDSPAAVAEPPKAEAGPWDKYPESTTYSGPWTKYEQPPAQGMGDLKTAENALPERPKEVTTFDKVMGIPRERYTSMAEEGARKFREEPLMSIPKPENKGVASGIVRGVATAAEALTTQENIGLMATIGGAPAALQKASSAGFAVMMGRGAVEGIEAGIEAETPGQKAEAFTGAAISLLMAGAAGKHAVGRPGKGGVTEKGELPRTGSQDIVLESAKAADTILNEPKPSQPSPEGGQPTAAGPGVRAEVPGAPVERTPAELGKQMAPNMLPREQAPVIEPPTARVEELTRKAEEIAGEPAQVSGKQEPIAPLSTERPVAEPVPVDPAVTSTKNVVTDVERAQRGAEPLESGAHVSNETTWKQAEAELQADPKKGANLVKELNEKPRVISSVENDVLLREKIAVHNRGKELMETINDEGATAEARARASEELSRNDADVGAIDTALRLGGTETGRALQARQKMAAEDFTLVAMRARVRAQQGGKELDAGQEATIRDLYGKLEASQKRIAELENKGSAEKAASTLKNLAGEGKQKPLSGPVRSKLMEKLKASHDEAVVNLRKRLQRTSAGVDPTMIGDIAKIGAYHIANGASKLGQFTAKMVKELGDWIKGDIKDIYKASKTEFNAARDAAREMEPADAREAVLQKTAGGTLTQKNVFDLARHHVNEGIVELNAVMDAVKKDLAESHPEITTRELRDLFSGYGEVRYPSKEADLVKLRELRRLGQLASAIEDAQRKIAPKKSGGQRDDPTQAIRDKMKELQAAMREAGIETTSPEQQLKSVNQARATALRNQIEDLERRIATGQKTPKGKPVADSAEVTELKQQRDTLKQEADRLHPEDTEAARVETAKKAIQRSTERLQERIAAGDYAPTPRREPATSKELEQLRFENAKVKQEFARKAFEAKLAAQSLPRKAFRISAEVANTARAVMTSVDLSAMFRQGGFIAFAHPIRALKSVGPMLRAFASEKGSFRVDEEIAARPNAKLYKASKLYLAEQSNHLPSKMEEAYMSRWAGKIPVVAGSARAYTTFLNKLRADSFDAMASTLSASGKPTLEEARAIANFINVATGRGTLGKAEAAGQALATTFFSPRYVASRFQLIAGQPFYGGNARTRKLVAQEYGRYLLGIGTLYALVAAAPEDWGMTVEADPRSSDFGKIKIGNTRVDVLSGLGQTTTFLSREITGETKTLKGKEVRLREDYRPLNLFRELDRTKKDPFGTDGAEVAARFLRTKLAPVPGAAVNIAAGRNVIGEPTSVGGELGAMAVPLSVRDIYETMREQGATRGTALMLLSLLGMGVQTYEDKPKK